jgi:glycerophosphoryl diester phosphodiesterase
LEETGITPTFMSRSPQPLHPADAHHEARTSVLSFFKAQRPLVFAHRGGCALGPENTLAAFDAGLATGADGLELDVHLSADGVLVVCHDATLDRTTAESGRLTIKTAAQLTAIRAGREFPAIAAGRDTATADPNLLTIPTLRAVFARYPDTRIIVEMKVDTDEMGQALASEVRAADAAHRVCAAGAGLRSLRAARRALPEMASSASSPEVRLALYRSWLRWPASRAAYGGYQVPEYAGATRVVSPRFIDHAHRAGLPVQVWTVDDEDDMRRLLTWGADALITNRPDVAVRVRDGIKGHTGLSST